jgi:hypothetical protein
MLQWFRQIDDARSTSEVVAVARDYFATWSVTDLARLPAPCRPGRMKGERDLEELHLCVVEEFRRSEATGDSLAALQRLTSFVVRASVRCAQLREDEDPQPGGPAAAPKRSAAPRKSR